MAKRGWVPTTELPQPGLADHVSRHSPPVLCGCWFACSAQERDFQEMPPSVAGAERGELDSRAQPPAHNGAPTCPSPKPHSLEIRLKLSFHFCCCCCCCCCSNALLDDDTHMA